MMSRSSATGAVWILLLASVAAQGSVRQVGPGRPFADIQSAVNAATNGDVVEVDPGTYAPFVIQGKQIAVIGNQSTGAGASFTVSGAPAITITGLQPLQQVTIAHARATATAAGPAIAISNQGNGNVRLLHVTVLSGDLGLTGYEGLIEVRDTGSLWCDRVRVGDYRFRCIGATGTSGLAALFVVSTPVQLARSVLQGNRSDDPSIGSGDAIRMVGGTLWAIGCSLAGGLPPLNGLPGVPGGHAIHDASGTAGAIRVCATTLVSTDPAVPLFAVQGQPSFLAACSPDSIARTELPPGVTEVAVGSTSSFTVSVEVGNQAFVTLLGTSFGSQPLSILLGDLLVGGSFDILTGGVLVTPIAIPITIPAQPTLVGLQCALQSVLVGPATYAAASAAGFTIR
jgi:hypothetical protein